MIPDELQDKAISYLRGELSPPDVSAFERECHESSELATFVRETSETLTALITADSAAMPPASLRERILTIPREGREPVPIPVMDLPGRPRPRASMGWIVATCVLAVLAVASLCDDWNQRDRYGRLENQVTTTSHDLDEVRHQSEIQQQEIASLQGQDDLSAIQVAALTSQEPSFAKASAIVIWDGTKKRGLVRLRGLPQLDAAKVYELWVIDGAATGPVSAGLLTVARDGSLTQSFQPGSPVGVPQKFAISVEKAGGSTQPKGPIVLIGG